MVFALLRRGRIRFIFDEQKLRQNPDCQLLRRFSAEVQPDRRMDKVQLFLRHAAFFELGKQRLDLPAAGRDGRAVRLVSEEGYQIRFISSARRQGRSCVYGC